MTRTRSGTTSTDARQRMVERQLRHRGIEDECVLAAMAEVPRERFLPPEVQGEAYRDGAVAIGEGQTMSQPWIVACMTSLLDLSGHERVLEIGTGSGYGAAVLSRCCAAVVTIERHAALAERAAAVLRELGYGNVEVRTGDGTLGAPDRAPFGGALVTAVADERPPQAIAAQFQPGAALVCAVRDVYGEFLTLFRDGHAERVVAVRFVPLVSDLSGSSRPA